MYDNCLLSFTLWMCLWHTVSLCESFWCHSMRWPWISNRICKIVNKSDRKEIWNSVNRMWCIIISYRNAFYFVWCSGRYIGTRISNSIFIAQIVDCVVKRRHTLRQRRICSHHPIRSRLPPSLCGRCRSRNVMRTFKRRCIRIVNEYDSPLRWGHSISIFCFFNLKFFESRKWKLKNPKTTRNAIAIYVHKSCSHK